MQEEGKNMKQNHAPSFFLIYTADYTQALKFLIRKVWSRSSRLTPVLLVVMFLCFDLHTRLQCIIRGKSAASAQKQIHIYLE